MRLCLFQTISCYFSLISDSVVEASLVPVQIALGLNFLAPAPLFPFIMEDFGLERGVVSLLVASVTVMMAMTVLMGSMEQQGMMAMMELTVSTE